MADAIAFVADGIATVKLFIVFYFILFFVYFILSSIFYKAIISGIIKTIPFNGAIPSVTMTIT